MTGSRAATAVLITAGLLLGAQPAGAYLHLTTTAGRAVVPLMWDASPVRWFATNRGAAGVSALELQTAVARAFASWEAIPSVSIAFQYVGTTSAAPFVDDDLSVVGFLDAPEMDRVLGATTFIIDVVTGEIVEADIFLNAAFPWSTSAGGDPTRFDVQSIATHEVGHLMGLGHSALGETEVRPEGSRRVLATGSVMFPIAFGRGNIADRTLQPDDVAGASALYPDGGIEHDTGRLRGRVRLGGRGVLGAHVVAFNPATGALIGALALTGEGDFEIAGLAPGPHVVRVEPLDDADVESFLSGHGVDINFQVAFHERLAVVPAGGESAPFDVVVRPK